MSALRVWRELHAEAREWQRESWQKFCDILPDDLRDLVGTRQGEGRVAVYGNTQVGKTTVMLRLLGIRETDMERVGNVLRGGRGLGRSATAVATEYQRSVDDHWHIDAPEMGHSPADSLNDDDTEKCLKELRIRMEAGKFDAQARPIIVHIPCGSFEEDSAPMNLLDLPGVGALGEREASWAARIASRYLPLMDLVLLVGRADDLSDFHPEAVAQSSGHKAMRYWTSFSDKFGLVLTHVAQSASIQQRIRRHDGPLSVDQLRRHVREEHAGDASVFDFPENARIYPLDLGDSWAKLAEKQPDIRAKTENCFKQMIRDLRRDIELAADPDRRSSILLKIKQPLAEKRHALQTEMKEVQTAYHERTTKRRQDIASLACERETLHDHINSLYKPPLQPTRSTVATNTLDTAYNCYDRKSSRNKDEESSLLTYLVKSKQKIREAVNKVQTEAELQSIPRDIIESYETAIMDCLKKIKDEYPGFIRNLFPGSDRNKYKKLADNTVKEAWTQVTHATAKYIEEIDRAEAAKIQNEIAEARFRVVSLEYDVATIEREIQAIETGCEEKVRRLEAEIDYVDQAKNYADKYHAHARQAFCRQVRAQVETMRAEPNHSVKFLRVLAVLHAIQGFEKLSCPADGGC
ncbi:MAG: hypothetical protein JNJ60_05490 [Rhodocyclaceae bacterium]|nr:hypothetical protein [Rhodocyclaceae bacterium]